MKSVKLTPQLLRRIIEEEVSKGFGEMEDVEKRAKDTDETDADELADSLEKKIDYAKALKVEEARLTKRLAQDTKRLAEVRQTRQRVLKSLQAKKS